jgi:hypothetical protein
VRAAYASHTVPGNASAERGPTKRRLIGVFVQASVSSASTYVFLETDEL